jgi:hypothetical protein
MLRIGVRMEIGDKIIDRFGNIGIVKTKLSLQELTILDGGEIDYEDEWDLPYVIAEGDNGGFSACEYEARILT